MATPKLPPNGFIGAGSQTAAVQHLTSKALGGPTRRKTRRKKVAKKRPVRRRKASPARRKRATARRGGKPAHMVKGSAAAKRHMAKLRKMRKR